ncbi:MAG: SH3 domain-containing protein [Oceanicaulis sp.]|nr:SH3 domain-containing protein [Oceanicaulis sp.]
MDISRIGFRQITLPHLGEVEANIFNLGTFRRLEGSDWDDPYEFVRMLLVERVEFDGEPPVEIRNLSESQLDEIACALWSSRTGEDWAEGDEDPIEVCDASTLLAAYKQELERHHARMREIAERHAQPIIRQSAYLKSMFEQINQDSIFDQIMQPTAFEQLRRSLMHFDYIKDQLSSPLVSDAQNTLGHLTENSALSVMLAQHRDAMSGISAVMESFRSQELAIQTVMRSLNIGALSAAIASAPFITPGSALQDIIEQGLTAPGFSYTAQAALAGLASQSASAEILAHYHEKGTQFAESFARALDGIRELDISEPNELSEHQADQILEAIFERLVELQNAATWMHPQNVIALAVLLTTAASLYFAAISPTSQQIEALQLQNKRLIELQEQDFARNEDRYRNDRRLTGRYYLRKAPNQESPEITLLNSDQIVAVEKTQGDWAFVRVYPYANEGEIKGWVHRNGLAPLVGG